MDTYTFTTTFIRKEQVARDAYAFYFHRENFHFLPGQYLRITIEDSHPDERGNSRFFTIASSPTEEAYIMITTRIIQSSFKKTLVDILPGTQVQLYAPLGKFVLDEHDPRPKIFIAGGIGITPFRSMITYAHDTKLTTPIRLFTSFRTPQDMLFTAYLDAIQKETPSIKVTHSITDSPEVIDNVHQGRINAQVITQESIYPDAVYYISGPTKMVDAMAEIVATIGIQKDRVIKENFPGY